jgi:tetratricopeptide (TPR) repeat protein
MKGDIAEGRLPGVLRELYVGRRTGLLHFNQGERRASVCFVRGQIVWGDSTDPECQLGPVLVRHGWVTQERLDRLRDRVGAGRRLGDVLLEAGVLDRAWLDDALALHVREILLTALSWPDAAYRFQEHPPEHFSGYDRALSIATGELILDAVWSVADPDVIRYALGDLGRVLRLPTDPLLRFQRLTLTPTEGYLLSRVDGTLTAREVLSLGPGEPRDAQRSLFGLLCTGMVEWAEEVARAEPVAREAPSRNEVLEAARDSATRTHYEVLGLARTATPDQVAEAFTRQARLFHPDGQHLPELADLGALLEGVFARVAEAHRVLSDPARRADYEARLDAAATSVPTPPAAPMAPATDFQNADDVLAAAEQEYREGRYWDALQAVEPVLEQLSARQLQRARLLHARVYMKNPKWRKDAEHELLSVTRDDPANVEAYFQLGLLYKEGGNRGFAVAMFRKVLGLKPRHAAARAELEALQTE